MMGTKLSVDVKAVSDEVSNPPDSFDARETFKEHVHSFRDQQRCESCWAFGAAEAFSDRLSIASKKAVYEVLSPEYQVACDRRNMGCNGGWLDKAWNFLVYIGIPTDKCVSYKSGDGRTKQCPAKCDDGSAIQTYKIKISKRVDGVSAMKERIMCNGPVEVGFTVYQDFMSYKSGINKHTSGGILEGHAVKAVGWGIENGTRYWIMTNSWNTNRSEQGHFRIAEKECWIDKAWYFGDPKL